MKKWIYFIISIAATLLTSGCLGSDDMLISVSNVTGNVTNFVNNTTITTNLTLVNVTDNGNYTYTWYYSDGNSSTTSNLRGAPGVNGTDGAQGPQGPQGIPGINGSAAVYCGANLSCVYDGSNVTIDDNRTLIASFNISNVTMVTANNSIVATSLYDGSPILNNVTVSGGILASYI